jgi:hypothetical protein
MSNRSDMDMDNGAEPIGPTGSEITDDFPGEPLPVDGDALETTDAGDIIAGIGNPEAKPTPREPVEPGPGFGTAAGASVSASGRPGGHVDVARGPGERASGEPAQ